MVQTIQCTQCQFENRTDAKFCQHCGAPLEQITSFRKILSEANQVLSTAIQSLQRSKNTPAPLPATAPATRRTFTGLSPKQPGELVGAYQILETIPLVRSNYYKVRRLGCICGFNNSPQAGETCGQCQKPLKKFILRETLAEAEIPTISPQICTQLSREIEGVLNHLQIFQLRKAQYVLLDNFPEPCHNLSILSFPLDDPAKAIEWTAQLGNALQQLHARRYTFCEDTQSSDWLEVVMILKNQQAYFADITSCTPVPENQPVPVQKDILYLTKVLYTLLSGDRQNVLRLSGQLLEIPAPYREVIGLARGGKFSSVAAFLSKLQETPQTPEIARSLRQLVGYGTDIGKQRDHNEDYVSKFSLGLEQIPGTPEVGLYIVADGMGGHQAGEKASEAVIKDVVINRIQEQLHNLKSVPKLKRATIKLDEFVTPGEILREAIEQANTVLFQARNTGQGRDRGTTITAALAVGETCAVANVGDSRTYLLRAGLLQKITQDHSLVASLVANGMIKESEVRSHPQRNQIYRSLGDKPQIEVDVFQKMLLPGDRLLLCSDGLWEMVLDDTISKIIQAARTPQAACDHLIEAANTAGGEDNISVIVVWIE